MAAIDKTYTDSWQDYCNLKEWAAKNKFTCPDGTIEDISRSIYGWWEENDFGKEKFHPVMNTSWVTDYYLIKYCPLEFVQERMLEVYDEEFVQSVKNGTSEYDTFTKEGKYGKHFKVVKTPLYGFGKCNVPLRRSKTHRRRYNKWWVQIDGALDYYKRTNKWRWEFELTSSGGTCSNTARLGTIQSVKRHLIKWKLPIGTVVRVMGNYVGEEYVFRITK